jgi:hypothetical protein
MGFPRIFNRMDGEALSGGRAEAGADMRRNASEAGHNARHYAVFPYLSVSYINP